MTSCSWNIFLRKQQNKNKYYGGIKVIGGWWNKLKRFDCIGGKNNKDIKYWWGGIEGCIIDKIGI